MSAPNVVVVDHPLVQHKLTHLRQKERSTSSFRSLLSEISALLAYEATRDLPLAYEAIETPLAKMTAPVLDGKKIVVVNILRAGTGMVEGMLQIMPSARVGHIGLYRDPSTLGAIEYYFKVPREMADRSVLVVDPMLATGNSAVAAVDRIKATSPKSIKVRLRHRVPRGAREPPRGAPRRDRVHRIDRRGPGRPRIHRARDGRRGRSPLRYEVTR